MLRDYYNFARSNHHFILFGLLTTFFGNYGQSFFIAWFGQSFIQDFDLSNSEYGLVYSCATIVSGFIILYVGGLLDKTPLRQFTFLTCAGLASAGVILYFASESWHLIIAIFLLRFCGQGLMYHIAFTSMARYFDRDRGKAIGLVGFGMPLGEAIMPALAMTLIATVGWRESWLVLSFLLLVVYWPWANYLLKQSQSFISQSIKNSLPRQSSTEGNWTRKQVIRDHRFWSLVPAVMAPAFIVTGIFIHQAVLLQAKGWHESWFAICFTVYAFSHLKASLVIGSLVDRFSGKKMMTYYLIPMFASLLLLAFPINHAFIALLFMFLLGLTIGASGPVVGSLWVEIYGNQNIGAIRSMVTSIMVVSTAISPVLFGWLFDNGYSYEEVIIATLIFVSIAWVLLMFSLKLK